MTHDDRHTIRDSRQAATNGLLPRRAPRHDGRHRHDILKGGGQPAGRLQIGFGEDHDRRTDGGAQGGGTKRVRKEGDPAQSDQRLRDFASQTTAGPRRQQDQRRGQEAAPPTAGRCSSGVSPESSPKIS